MIIKNTAAGKTRMYLNRSTSLRAFLSADDIFCNDLYCIRREINVEKDIHIAPVDVLKPMLNPRQYA